ncbi:MAG: MAC/perforin domain-containing protein [Pirellulales bacterium]
MVLAADPAEGTESPSVLLSHVDDLHLGFSLLTDASRKRIGISDGRRTQWSTVDLSDGDFHHLAIVTSKDISEIYLDDKYVGYIPAGYGPSASLPFELGGVREGFSPFTGEIAALRMWSSPLSAQELSELKFYGPPPPSHRRFSDLTAASLFTADSEDVLIYSPPATPSEFLGSDEGLRIDQLMLGAVDIRQISVGVQVLPNASDGTPQTRIVGVVPHFVTSGDVATLRTPAAAETNRLEAEATAYSDACARALIFDLERMVPSIGPALQAGWTKYLQVEETKALVGNWDPQRRGDVVHTLARYSLEIFELNDSQKEILGSSAFRAAEQSLARWLNDLDARSKSTPATTLNAPTSGVETKLLQLEKGEVIVGAAATYGTHLHSLRFITNRRLWNVFGTANGPNSAVVQIPLTSRLSGFTEVRDDAGLLGLALTYRVAPDELTPAGTWANQHPLLPPATNLGRFQAEDQPEVVRDDDTVRRLALTGDPGALSLIDSRDGNIHIHGNYTSYPVYRLLLTVDGRLILATDNPTSPLSARVEHGLEIFEPIAGRVDAFRSTTAAPAGSRQLTMLDDGTFVLDGKRYMPSTPFDASGDPRDKIPWGGTFSTEQRPSMSEFNVKGYNVEKLDPRNYQLSTGTPNRVFAWPADGDVDYQTTTNGKIIPNGLIYRNDRQAMERARSHYAATQEEHSRAWNVNLGFQIGIPGLLSFGLDGSYQHERSDMSRSGSGRTISMAQEVKYALVLDRARVALDEGFYRRVLRIRDDKLAGKHPDYASLVDSFGTNYPYAVTYGGTAFQEKDFTDAEAMTTTSQGFNISQQSSATLEGVTVGRTIGGGSSWSDSSGSSSKDEDDGVQTIGGELSKGGGWSLPDHSEVPVLLDLRPLDELFSPLFFSDPIVWKEMRNEVHNYLGERATSRARTLDTDNFGPRYFELRLDEIENNTSGDLTLPNQLGVASTLFNVTAWRQKSRRPGGPVDLVDLQVQGKKYSGKSGDQAPLAILGAGGFKLANQEYQWIFEDFNSVTADGDTPRFAMRSCLIQYKPHQFANGGYIWLTLPDGFPWIIRNVIPEKVGQFDVVRTETDESKTMVTLFISPDILAGKGEIVLGTREGKSMMSAYYSFRELSLDRDSLLLDK